MNCSNVITIPQYGMTCWFNAILMSVLYSEKSRKLILDKSKKWDLKIEVYKIIKEILKKKYIKKSNNDFNYFNIIKPETILKKLHSHNKKKFYINENVPFFVMAYIRKIYKFLGASLIMFDKYDNDVYYSIYNSTHYISEKIKFKIKKNIYKNLLKNKNPEIIIMHNNEPEYSIFKPHYPKEYNNNLTILKNKKELMSNKEVITYNNEEYILDSVILHNWNTEFSKVGHAISGIKCKKEKYVYNGWIRYTIDDAMKKSNEKLINSYPCELIKYNWDINYDHDFCLNTKKCKLDNPSLNIKDLCFSFGKGKRIYIYIKKNISKIDKTINKKECPEGKVLNPLTNRCIKIKTINKKTISKKECPEGKVLNPLTNRCIKIKSIIEKKLKKECPEGKVLNPLTNRCIKIKSIIEKKLKKECPEGKVLNPLTNRCIKIKSIIEKKLKKECPSGKILNPLTNRCIKIKAINKL